MAKKEEDTKINVLMNIGSYYGEHQGRMKPMIIFLLVSSAPIFLYLLLFIGIIPFKFILIFEVPFVFRMALKILGKEDEKFKVYMASREDEYANADDIIGILNVHDDGLIEYGDGTVAYIISTLTTTYFNEDILSSDIEKFLQQLSSYTYDIHIHLVVKELLLQNSLESMKVYTDKELLKERVQFYVYQDEQCINKSQLYRVNFVVKSSKYEWKKLKMDLDVAVSSVYSKVFKECYVCNREQTNEVMSRDLYTYIDFQEMLQRKYKNDEYFGSKVLYYGEEVPEEYKEKKEVVNIEERRVVEKRQESV